MPLKNTCKYEINLEVGDQLTSISCANIVAELIKLIVYQRLQIPYKYEWLKQIVNKKVLRNERGITDSVHSERHFLTASKALSSLDFILKGLQQEIGGPSMPLEVCITLGTSPALSKEVYRIILPVVCHRPQCQSAHIAKDQKLQRDVFRELVTSNAWSQMLSEQLPPKNMHVFIKKNILNNQEVIVNREYYIPTCGSRISNSKIFTIAFVNTSETNTLCCNNFKIFGDVEKTLEQKYFNSEQKHTDVDKVYEIQSTDSTKWFQSSYVFQGFKDCIVNGSSVINTWLES